ncbi:LysM peptidoglycan-binding domain-containing protein [Leifsonia sp. ZF2019]|uniref:LysM peptidoglycan-binding domain-containing protein n=1 Tax=Leifsonia sp. ZF2019 TaxID=2781978 RepID=UPI001CBBC7A8|nr:LysM peptidoglycan-binding domain-containing protein [Leifsonia sp. ZF2019]UAJ78097.1 LysM peptidoglycan-binding domain-containing protein [Leifsonia sp. ZF2019]
MSVRDDEAATHEPVRHWARSVLGTVPIAVASSIAVTLNLVTPAQAVPPETAEQPREKTPTTGSTRMAPASAGTTTSAPLTAFAGVPSSYTVVSGDTVSGIASRFGVSTASLLALNGLSWKSLIFPGQVLALTGAAASAPAPSAPGPAAPAVTKYSVVSGDTISRIAGRFGVSTASVLSANGLSGSSLIFPGQQITIPGMTTAAAVTPKPPAPAPVAAPAPLPVAAAGQVVALTDEMRGNAALIVRIGRQEGVSDQGIVIALAAAAQESGLRNVRYGDRDSLGLFQQRPSTGWGTADQVLDPERATRAFFGGANNPNPGRTRGLLDIPGWTSMTVTQAAQAVQISAFPDAYAKWETSARAWLAQLG